MTSPVPNPDVIGDTSTTRSLLGWGVAVGPIYLIVGVVLALVHTEFALWRDPLSLLLLGELGWAHWANLVLSGLMTIVAAVGLKRVPGWSNLVAALVAFFGACLVLSAVFPPDATQHFPPGAETTEGTSSGVLHLIFGALGFVSIAAAALISAFHLSPAPIGHWSKICGVTIMLAFIGGAVFASSVFGIALIWLAVLCSWGWLAMISLTAHRTLAQTNRPLARGRHRLA